MPATYLLDPGGRVVHAHTGSGDDDWQRLVGVVAEIAGELDAP